VPIAIPTTPSAISTQPQVGTPLPDALPVVEVGVATTVVVLLVIDVVLPGVVSVFVVVTVWTGCVTVVVWVTVVVFPGEVVVAVVPVLGSFADWLVLLSAPVAFEAALDAACCAC
jgi:hypothetical protein